MARMLIAAVSAGLALPAPALADYTLELVATGKREYYCTATMRLTNRSDTTLTEISGHFFVYVDGAQAGRSKGTWFIGLAPGDSAEAVFETPNAPCTELDRYDFVIGACRIAAGFEDPSVCASLTEPVAPVRLAPP